jgi:hypothetical protein
MTPAKDFYKMALEEWRRNNPDKRRASDLSNEDREWIIRRAEELEAANG